MVLLTPARVGKKKSQNQTLFFCSFTVPVSIFGEQDGEGAGDHSDCHRGLWVVCGEVFVEGTTALVGGWEELRRHWLPRLSSPLLGFVSVALDLSRCQSVWFWGWVRPQKCWQTCWQKTPVGPAARVSVEVPNPRAELIG